MVCCCCLLPFSKEYSSDQRARYDLGHIWPPLKIYSNVVFYVRHHIHKTQLKNEHVTTCTRKVIAIFFYMHFDQDLIRF